MTKIRADRAAGGANPHLRQPDVELIVTTIFDEITDALARGDRVELRGFGAFSTKERDPRTGRNPRTGEAVEVSAKSVPYFKPGKELRERINKARRRAGARRGARAGLNALVWSSCRWRWCWCCSRCPTATWSRCGSGPSTWPGRRRSAVAVLVPAALAFLLGRGDRVAVGPAGAPQRGWSAQRRAAAAAAGDRPPARAGEVRRGADCGRGRIEVLTVIGKPAGVARRAASSPRSTPRDLARAEALAARAAPRRCGVLKVGLELFCAAGAPAVRPSRAHAPVFLDLKLHDIPNTVAGRACASLLPLRPAMADAACRRRRRR